MAQLSIHNPATGALIQTISADTAASVAAKAESARQAQGAWAQTSLAHRVEIVAKFRAAVVAELETLAATLTAEVGKPISQSRNELNGLLPRLDFFMAQAQAACAPNTVFNEYVCTDQNPEVAMK